MKKLFKKFLAVIMVVVMTLTAAPLNGFVGLDLPNLFDFMASAATYSGTCGNNLTWTLNTKTGQLNISGSGAMDNYDSTVEPWYSYTSYIKSIIIGDSVTTVGEYAFFGCENLTSLTLGNKVKNIGEVAFASCKSLTSVIIPDSVKTIGSDAFAYCIKLTSLTIGSSVTTIGKRAFENCESLTSVAIPNSVTTIGEYSFFRCTGLTSVTLGNSVTTIGNYAFCGCTGLTSLTLGKNVTTIGDYAFEDCTGLTSLTISKNLETIGSDAFYGCNNLSDVYYDGTKEEWNISVGPGNEPLKKATIHFAGAEQESNIVSGICGDNLTWTLDKNTGLLNISGSGEMWGFCSSDIWNAYIRSIKTVNIGNSVTTIGSHAFDNCYNLTSVTIGNSVTLIDCCAFRYCKKLTSITIPDSVTTIGEYAFCDCDEMVSVTISDSVTTIDGLAFYSCDSLTSITVDADNQNYSSDSCGVLFNKDKTILKHYPAGNRRTSYTVPESVKTIDYKAFYHCYNLTSVTISDGVTTICEDAFRKCYKLVNITIPDSVTTIGEGAFWQCHNLTGVTISDGVTTISDDAFYECTNLTSVIIGNNVTTIGDGAFFKCSFLRSIVIPDSVTTINNHAFDYCEALKSITIRDSVTTIGDYAFYRCNNLTKVYYTGTEEQWNEISVGSYNDTLLNATIHFDVPESIIAFGECKEKLTWTLYESGLLEISGTGAMADFTEFSTPWFSYRSSIKTVEFENGITTIGEYAFENCDSLTSVTIPDSVKTIGDYAFRFCDSLTSATIGNSVTTIGKDAFYSCDNLTSITVDANNQNYSSDSCGVLFDKDKTALIQYPIGNTRTSYTIPDNVKYIRDYAFEASNLTSITIPRSVTSIRNFAFNDCNSLTEIYYGGTKEDWKNISIGSSGNYLLSKVTIHYHEHSYTSFITTASTCNKEGVLTYTCGCGYSYTEAIAKKPHTSGEWETILKPTTEADGKKIKKCTICGETAEEKVIEKITEPEFDEAVVPSPSQSTINYGDSIVLHIDSEKIPEGGYVEWVASNNNFTFSVSEEGTTCTISPSVSGDTTFTATVYDEDGRPILTDEQVMTSKAGFFQKFIAFFKKLFGLSKVILQSK